MPPADEFVECFSAIWDAASAGVPITDEALVEPLNAALRKLARERDSITYSEIVMRTQEMSRLFAGNWGRDFDVLLTPTMAVEPPRCGSIWEGADDDPMMAFFNSFPMGVFTSLFNVTGQPALSLPVHLSPSGLPVGVQLAGAPWADALLLQLGNQLEPIFGWADRHPTSAG